MVAAFVVLTPPALFPDWGLLPQTGGVIALSDFPVQKPTAGDFLIPLSLLTRIRKSASALVPD
ncbi:hypothetical protein OB13_12885 [Pontibacter sp. HJ8]